MMLNWKLFSLALAAVVICGCSKSEPLGTVKGVVTFKGQPVAEATVSFRNQKTGDSASDVLDEEGKYEIRAAGGMDPGDYQVIILPPEVEVSLGPNSPPAMKPKDMPNVPKKYQSAQTSTLLTVLEAGTNEVDLELSE
ncbi:carboxypeptidase-like regulatory domain-containing protein [Bremerella sp. JC817]|uniref:carboxypeptidase-like regulatory domain-containing protein n=1 Tax=Bremerella sp. JC817 TaxID=3231756 RepID=UPI003458C66E